VVIWPVVKFDQFGIWPVENLTSGQIWPLVKFDQSQIWPPKNDLEFFKNRRKSAKMLDPHPRGGVKTSEFRHVWYHESVENWILNNLQSTKFWPVVKFDHLVKKIAKSLNWSDLTTWGVWPMVKFDQFGIWPVSNVTSGQKWPLVKFDQCRIWPLSENR